MSERTSPRTDYETPIAHFLKCPIPIFMLDSGVHRKPVSKEFRL